MKTNHSIQPTRVKKALFRGGVFALVVGLLQGALMAGAPGLLRVPQKMVTPPELRIGVTGPSLTAFPKVLRPVRLSGPSVLAPVASPEAPSGVVLKAVIEEGKLRVMATAERPHLVLQVRQEEGWSPIASRHLRGEGAVEVVFELPTWTKGKTHRVMAFADAGFPMGFTGGERIFPARHSGYGFSVISAPPVLDNIAFTNTANVSGIRTFATTTAGTVQNTDAAQAVSLEAPVEADIWKMVGTRLLFFNQYRGLQVFDLSNPAAPVKTGALRMSAVGEQLYVLNGKGTMLALVTDVPGANGAGETEIVMVEVSVKGEPKEISRFRMSGHHEDSRLIGNELHLVLTQSEPFPDQVALVSVNVSRPKALTIRSSQEVPGWMPKLQAVEGHLLVATTNSANYGWVNPGDVSTLHVFRVLKAGGTERVKALPLKGVVLDKFKMNLTGGALVAVTQSRGPSSWMLQTWVETFPMEGDEVAPLAQVSIPAADWETLYATRFDGTKVYVVTFRQIDPLFVVDLANPANPVITGELEVPGWSTYLLPRGEQLLAVGVENGQATVSLFGVSDPAQPTLLSRVSLLSQARGGWSSTEANYDEKAVEYFPEAGLLLLPFQKSGYAAATGRAWTERGIQVVRVGRNDLELGEVIPHEFDARRGTLLKGHYVSISGRELIVLKQGAGAAPPVAQISLAWQVDDVVPFGDYLLQMERGSPQAMLRVTTARNPDGLLEEIDPGPGAIVGVERRGDEVFLAQKIWKVEELKGGGSREVYGMRTWRFDLSRPPVVKERGRVESWEFGDGALLGGAQGRPKARAVWPREDLLVWEVKDGGWFGEIHFVLGGPINTIGIGWSTPNLATLTIAAVVRPFGEAVTLALDDLPQAPRERQQILGMLWPVSLTQGQMRSMSPVPLMGGFSDRLTGEVMAQNGFVFVGMDVREAPWVADAEKVNAIPVAIEKAVESGGDPEAGARLDFGFWYYMPQKVWSAVMVADFTQKKPVVREPVGMPGALVAVANVGQAGGVLVAEDAIKQEVRTMVYDGVACWIYADMVLHGKSGLMSAGGDVVCRSVRNEASGDVRLEACLYDKQQRHFARGGVWSEPGAEPAQLRVRENLVFMGMISDGKWEFRLADIGAGARFENRRKVTMPANDATLSLDCAVGDPLGAGLWVPQGLYGVAYFGALR